MNKPQWQIDIEERAAKASAAPWNYEAEYADDPRDTPNWVVYPEANEEYSIATVNGQINDKHEAEFIAHSRQDVPHLLSALNKMREAIEKAAHGWFCTMMFDRERGCNCWKSEALNYNPTKQEVNHG